MAVNYSRLKSKSGFESPGFVVNSSGNVAANSLTLDGGITATGAFSAPSISTDSITINSLPLFTNNGTTLSPTVIGSSLVSVGTLNDLTVDGNVRLRLNGENKISIIDGRVEIKSTTRGEIENVNIGTEKPGTLRATNVTVIDDQGSPGSLTAAGANINFNASVIAGTVSFSSAPSAGTAPTNGDDLVRKDYVDNNSIAYAVVFGA
jgi:hypothetical protein